MMKKWKLQKSTEKSLFFVWQIVIVAGFSRTLRGFGEFSY